MSVLGVAKGSILEGVDYYKIWAYVELYRKLKYI